MLSSHWARSTVVAFLVAASLAFAVSGGAEQPGGAAKDAGAKGGTMAIDTLRDFIAQQKIDKSQPGWKTRLPRPPKASFDAAQTYYWSLDTNVGNVKVKLLPQVAPMHVSSTIYLTELGFYDGTPFHRVIPGFMAQGGCPLGTGTGSPGYRFDGELDAKVRHDKPGVLSMANAGPGTDGSQFFLTFKATPHLDGRHTVFGNVVDGQDTLRALEQRGSPSGRTSEKLEIKKTTIVIE